MITDSTPASLSTEGGGLCPVCEHRVEARIELPDYRLFACVGCGCWSSDALARGATLSFDPARYFEHAARDEVKWEELQFRRAGRQVRRVLDVGCGNGAFLTWIARRIPGVECIGIELDAQRALQAQRANPGARIHTGDAVAALADVEPPVDLVTLWDVFEHVPAPARLLEGLARLLAPDGAIYIQTINEESLVPALGRLSYRLTAGRLTGIVRRTHEPHHVVFFTRTGLRGMAERADLDITQLWFDRLAHARMDGNPIVTAATAMVLGLENALGNGLFVNLILRRKRARDA